MNSTEVKDSSASFNQDVAGILPQSAIPASAVATATMTKYPSFDTNDPTGVASNIEGRSAPPTSKTATYASSTNPSPTSTAIDTHPSHRIVLSLNALPYKSIMHAHFRLIGPGPKITGTRNEYYKQLEKEVAVALFHLLKRPKNDRGGETKGEVIFFKRIRGESKQCHEEVEDGWAVQKIHKDLIRRMESYRTWVCTDSSVSDDDRLVFTQEDYEKLKLDITIKTNEVPLTEEEISKVNSASNAIENKIIGYYPDTASVVTNTESSSSCGQSTKTNDTTKLDKEIHKAMSHSKRKPGKDRMNALDKCKPNANRLEARIAGMSRTVKVKVTMFNHEYKTPDSEVGHDYRFKKAVPTRFGYTDKQSSNAVNKSYKFVTPTASTFNKCNFYFTSLKSWVGPQADNNSIQLYDPAPALSICFEKYSRRAATFERGRETLFPEVLHAMLTNASLTIPTVLRWTEDGSAFIVGNVDKMGLVLREYFRHSNHTSFVRQLNVYGWRRTQGSFHHPLFHRDMDLGHSTLNLFGRFRSTRTPLAKPTAPDTPFALFKRDSFRSVSSGVNSAYRSVVSNPDEDNKAATLQSHTENMVVAQSKTTTELLDPPKRKRGRPRKVRPAQDEIEPSVPKPKRGPGRPRKYPKSIQETNGVFTVPNFTLACNSTESDPTTDHTYSDYDQLLAEAIYETYWMEKPGEAGNELPLQELVKEEELMSSVNTLNVARASASTNRSSVVNIGVDPNQIPSKRLSFMPSSNSELQTNYFSPIHHHSFSQKSLFFEDAPSVKPNYNTPSKDQNDVSMIEFSWKSSTSYYYEPAKGSPTTDSDDLVPVIPRDCYTPLSRKRTL